ncbi:CDC27 [Candida oxycetoniae]|uniref:CDC27 n=1 Tax=Candida oxycetoniae TaxID=497107 RepID=A0AAI9SVU9_9ASCO|nr:CDC27 [Candida oxycetoniae]KAI3404028.2 CDC27 [Candida oxycetoniae]
MDGTSLDSIYLYCLSLYRQNKYKSCYRKLVEVHNNLTPLHHLGCSYLYARCCLYLKKFKDGIAQLLKVKNLYDKEVKYSIEERFEYKRSIVPDASAVYHLLGDLYSATNDIKNSTLSYTQCLRLNQFDFEAFQKVSKLGVNMKVRSLYKQKPSTDSDNPFGVQVQSPPLKSIHVDDFNFQTPRVKQTTVPDAPLRKSNLNTDNTFEFVKPEKRRISRYSRITSRLTTAPAETPKRTNSDGITYIKELEKVEAYLLQKYSVFAKSFKCLTTYDCYKAIKILENFSSQERETPWVLSKLGRLHYEVTEYKKSLEYFEKLREVDRARLEDMEYFSTLLWHLKNKTKLTLLANEMKDIDSQSAITWIVIGNLFSLNKEPEEAIRAFNKSLKLQPLSYAYTLIGHEYMALEDLEKASSEFYRSLSMDERNYSALYGLGMVHLQLGEMDRAEYYIRKGISINPTNVILITTQAMILERAGRLEEAILCYKSGCEIQPTNPLPRLKKAQILIKMEQYSNAIETLEILKGLAPNEASVYFLLGELYKLKNDKFRALKELSIAMTLDPKAKVIIENSL